MERLIGFLFDTLLAAVLKIVGILLTLTILLQIFSRFIMIHPFSWTEELSRFAFIWFCFLGSAFTLRKNLHLGIDYFYRKFNPRLRRAVEFFIQLLILFFGYLLVHFGFIMVGMTTFQKSPIMRLPMSYMYAVLPATGFFFVIFSVYQLQLLVKNKVGGRSA